MSSTITGTVIQGDCLEVMKGLEGNSIDLILTDPPYHRCKNIGWDRQWSSDGHFIDWIGAISEQWQRILKPNGSLYCFASHRMSARVEVKLAERLNVLTRITWQKPPFSTKAEMFRKSDLRAFFPASESIIFCEHYGADNAAKGEAGYGAKCDELRGFVFEPLRAYLDGERMKAGLTVRQVAEAFQRKTGSRTVTGMAGHWFTAVQWTLPTEANYEWLAELCPGQFRLEYESLRLEYESLRLEYESLRLEYESLRRPFNVTAEVPYTDVWTFPTVQAYKGKHVCEKPAALLEHAIAASSLPGAVVLDCFAGSGSTLLAAKRLGRNFIGIEIDPHWVDVARGALGQTQEFISANQRVEWLESQIKPKQPSSGLMQLSMFDMVEG
jgi:adenine-specific DNA-methyltransferase